SATLQRIERLERGLTSGAPAPRSAPARVETSGATVDSEAPRASGEPRRRGAEAMAALREKKGTVAQSDAAAHAESVPGVRIGAADPAQAAESVPATPESEPVVPTAPDPASTSAEAAPAPESAGAASAPEPSAGQAPASERADSAVAERSEPVVAQSVPEPAAAEPVASAASSAGDVLAEVEAAWGDIRAKVREFGAAVHALLSGASVARVEDDTIVLAHQHAPLAHRLSNPQYVDAVQSAVYAVIGRRYSVRWEVGSSGSGGRPASRGGSGDRPASSGGTGQSGPGQPGAGQSQPPRFTRPSQTQTPSAATETPSSSIGQQAAEPAQRREIRMPEGRGGSQRDSGNRSASQISEDEIPPPEAPDYPDDPGPPDYSSVGYEGVPPALTPEEEQEMFAESARPVPPEQRRDPDEVALELLQSELGAVRLGG
ncbi:MAG: hypothetical protein J2P18_19710, partial [Nocardia sp.]|nr:hypothetical protein [Nocardia sp.]